MIWRPVMTNEIINIERILAAVSFQSNEHENDKPALTLDS